jgi:hypothetical protein
MFPLICCQNLLSQTIFLQDSGKYILGGGVAKPSFFDDFTNSFPIDFFPPKLVPRINHAEHSDRRTTMILSEVIRLFQFLNDGHLEVILGDKEFHYYWHKYKEQTSSLISGIHVGHYKTVT